ncbi:MAG: pilus assembly protein PilM [Verrucomicrobia bacterium]|nr:pilus assembly protein PilM [Verrucomicrobiota bacterium]
MGLPFVSNGRRKRDQVVAVDLGSRVTKAVHVQRSGGGYKFLGYACVEAPVAEKIPPKEVLAEHLKKVLDALGSRVKQVSLTIGVSDSELRFAEMPLVPVEELRAVLRFSGKNYVQQDLKDSLFDCHLLLPRDISKEPVKGVAKTRVVIGIAQKNLVDELQAAAKMAGAVADQITLSYVGPANAFEMAMPEVFAHEVVALVDIGYRNTTISILQTGQLMLSRVVSFGAQRLTANLAESLGVTPDEAENSKIAMTPEVESAAQAILVPLGRELRASIDFIDHQLDKSVSQVFFSGGSARNNAIVQSLQTELMVPCQAWNPTSFLTLALPAHQLAEVESVAPQLAVAVGAAMSAF